MTPFPAATPMPKLALTQQAPALPLDPVLSAEAQEVHEQKASDDAVLCKEEPPDVAVLVMSD